MDKTVKDILQNLRKVTEICETTERRVNTLKEELKRVQGALEVANQDRDAYLYRLKFHLQEEFRKGMPTEE